MADYTTIEGFVDLHIKSNPLVKSNAFTGPIHTSVHELDFFQTGKPIIGRGLAERREDGLWTITLEELDEDENVIERHPLFDHPLTIEAMLEEMIGQEAIIQSEYGPVGQPVRYPGLAYRSGPYMEDRRHITAITGRIMHHKSSEEETLEKAQEDGSNVIPFPGGRGK